MCNKNKVRVSCDPHLIYGVLTQKCFLQQVHRVGSNHQLLIGRNDNHLDL